MHGLIEQTVSLPPQKIVLDTRGVSSGTIHVRLTQSPLVVVPVATDAEALAAGLVVEPVAPAPSDEEPVEPAPTEPVPTEPVVEPAPEFIL